MDLRESTEVEPLTGTWRKAPAVVVWLFFLAAIGTTLCSVQWREGRLLSWDSRSYQLYLTASIVHRDLLRMEHLRVKEPHGRIHYGEQHAINRHDATGNVTNKYPMGTALFQAPFFLLAHAYCLLFDPTAATDGFSPPYQLSAAIASAFWAAIGLWYTDQRKAHRAQPFPDRLRDQLVLLRHPWCGLLTSVRFLSDRLRPVHHR